MTTNTQDIKDLKKQGVKNIFSINDLYERVVRLETKLDLLNEGNQHTRTNFYWISAVMIVLQVLVLVVHLLYYVQS